MGEYFAQTWLVFLVLTRALLSSGQTSQFSTTSEAESYHRLALVSRLIPSSSTDEKAVFTRATTEPFALDSYQNLLFSIARFREYTGESLVSNHIFGSTSHVLLGVLGMKDVNKSVRTRCGTRDATPAYVSLLLAMASNSLFMNHTIITFASFIVLSTC